MKIKLFLAALLFGLFTVVEAANTLSFSISKVGANLAVDIFFDNTDEVGAITFDYLIPSGMNLVNCAAFDRTKQADGYNDVGEPVKVPSWNFTKSVENGVVKVAATPAETSYKLQEGNGKICRILLSTSEEYIGNGSEMVLNSVAFGNNGNIIETSFPAGKIGNGGYSTFSAQQVHVKFDASKVKAYYGEVADDVLNLVAADGNVVYQNNGVILKGTEGTSIIATSVPASEATAPTKNDLKDAPRGATVEANSAYVLATVGEVTCFYQYTGTTIPAGKAYLPASLVSSGAPIRIEEETSGIETIEATTEQATVSYDLFGRANKSVKGAVAIENGKKVIRF